MNALDLDILSAPDGTVVVRLPEPGRFRLRFDTAGYLGADAFFPEVALQFAVERPDEHLHVPLLLSPFGYSTYRGS